MAHDPGHHPCMPCRSGFSRDRRHASPPRSRLKPLLRERNDISRARLCRAKRPWVRGPVAGHHPCSPCRSGFSRDRRHASPPRSRLKPLLRERNGTARARPCRAKRPWVRGPVAGHHPCRPCRSGFSRDRRHASPPRSRLKPLLQERNDISRARLCRAKRPWVRGPVARWPATDNAPAQVPAPCASVLPMRRFDSARYAGYAQRERLGWMNA